MSKLYKSAPEILKTARNYLDGLILSDGNICSNNITTGRYQQTCEKKEWLDDINKYLLKYEIISKVNNGRVNNNGFYQTNSLYYGLWTNWYIEFQEMRNRWYEKWYDIDDYNQYYWHKDKDEEYFIWKKIVPKDICLSPACVANMYIGDGNIYKHLGCNSYRINIATICFTKEDINFLSNSISSKIGIKTRIEKNKTISIGKLKDVVTFLDYIKDYKIDCYSKKFPDHLMK